jgi:hypothetical protein
MGHGYRSADGWFLDPHGRRTLLRGVNLGGSSKLPSVPDGSTHRGVDFERWADVSFVGRPFPLAEADHHLDRIAHWGFGVLRLLVTWEAIEHAGPGRYDEAYLDYVREVVRRAGQRGLLVFIDPHHDVWSRFTGGDGAPAWCFEWAGLRLESFLAARAVKLHAFDWPSNYESVPVATMWTLFLGGDTWCPELRGVQTRLQDHYIAALCALAERLADQDHVLGYDTCNEPSNGYIGRGEDLARARTFFEDPRREPPWSPLERLAAGEGRAVRASDGRVLDPAGVSIWRDGCPWRRAGVWDVDARGTPVLTDPGYFRRGPGGASAATAPRHPQRGAPGTARAWTDGLVPFVRRLRTALRRVHPDCFLFLEGSPRDFDTVWDDPDPFVCNARHWYDVTTLATRRFDPAAYRSLSGSVLCGADAIAAEFSRQLAGLAKLSRERMGNPPMLIGEFGIPYEMNGAAAYASGDYSLHEQLLDANYRALEEQLLSSTQWNYTADNSHALGDRWNQEDLSIFSADDQRDPRDLDSGGRATRAFCRPYVRHSAGTPLRMRFELSSARFELEIEADPGCTAPNEIYVPRLHYPNGARCEVSTGSVRLEPARQRLLWSAPGASGRQHLSLAPAWTQRVVRA